MLYIANVGEDDLTEDNVYVTALKKKAGEEGRQVIEISAKIEEEIAQLPDDERDAFLEDLGLHESGLDQVIRTSYDLLGLMSFLTAGPDECRAWTIQKERRRRRRQGRSTPISNAVSSAPKSRIMTISSPQAPTRRQENTASPVGRRKRLRDAGRRRRIFPLQRVTRQSAHKE